MSGTESGQGTSSAPVAQPDIDFSSLPNLVESPSEVPQEPVIETPTQSIEPVNNLPGTEPVVTPEPEPFSPSVTKNDDGSFAVITKVNGEEKSLNLSPEELIDRVRKGATFFDNQATLQQEKEAFQLEKSQFQGVDQSLLNQVKVLEQLKETDPVKYNELVYKTNNAIIERENPAPLEAQVPESISKQIAEMREVVKANPQLEILESIAQATETMALGMSQKSIDMDKALQEIRESHKGTDERAKANEAKGLKEQQLAKDKAYVDTLLTRGVTLPEIQQFSQSFDALVGAGHTYAQAEQVIYSRFFKAAPAATPAPALPETKPAETVYSPMTPGKGKGAVDGTKVFEKVNTALFGDFTPAI